MIPIRFGPPLHQLYGSYQPPAGENDRRHSVLLCSPFGQEAIRCHRLLRVLGDRLSREGFHVLRFDYFGTGDADGNDDEVTFSGWLHDIQAAHRELVARSGCTATSWFGLRLGATAAAIASANCLEGIQHLVIWDSVFDGRHYLAEITNAHLDCLRREMPRTWQQDAAAQAAQRDSPEEVLGFPISKTLRDEISAINMNAVVNLRAARVSIIGCDPQEVSLQRFVSLRQQQNKITAVVPIQNRIVWASSEAMNSAIVPADALHAAVECLVGGS